MTSTVQDTDKCTHHIRTKIYILQLYTKIHIIFNTLHNIGKNVNHLHNSRSHGKFILIISH